MIPSKWYPATIPKPYLEHFKT